MFKYLFMFVFILSCSVGPVKKELKYSGESVASLSPQGLMVAHVTVPKDRFPYDKKSTIIYLENIRTKEAFQYGDTQGPAYMKLPPGHYRVMDLWKPTGCHSSTGIMITNFFHELPDSVNKQRAKFQRMPKEELRFTIKKGQTTDLGNLLVTCMEWDEREKFRQTFADYIADGKFEQFKLPLDTPDCSCRLLRKKDGISIKAMREDLKKKN